MQKLALTLACLVVVATVACLDPLYEDLGTGSGSGQYGVCCVQTRVNTCACPSAEPCEFPMVACSGGSCVAHTGSSSAACFGGTVDGGIVMPPDGGPTDAGADAGVVDAGVNDAGQPPTHFVACCESGRVDTCPCYASGCAVEPFVPCAGGACVNGADAICR